MSTFRTFHPATKLWFYTANRDLTLAEIDFVELAMSKFLPEWTAHNNRLKAAGNVFFNRILMLAVDETQAGVSGCGIDKSVRFVEQIGASLGVDFFDRMQIGYQNADKSVDFEPISAFSQKIKAGVISENVEILDTLVATKMDFDAAFFKPISATWVKRFI
jgi:hypothetical protein